MTSNDFCGNMASLETDKRLVQFTVFGAVALILLKWNSTLQT
jgi:hypothetical protein